MILLPRKYRQMALGWVSTPFVEEDLLLEEGRSVKNLHLFRNPHFVCVCLNN